MMPFLANASTIANEIAKYNRMGDVGVVALCIMVFILLSTSYVVRNKSYRVFNAIVGFIFVAAIINVGFGEVYNLHITNNPYITGLLYSLRLFYQILLFNVFFAYALYTTIVTNMPHKKARIVALVGTGLFLGLVIADICLTFSGVGFTIHNDSGYASEKFDIFMVGYLIFIVFIGILMLGIRKLIYKKVLWGFYLSSALAVIIRIAQWFLKESSLTTLTFMIPTLSMLYTMHLNPYNISTGTLDARALEDMVNNLYKRKKAFIIMSLMLPDFVGEGKSLPEAVKYQTRRFTIEYFRDGTLFQIGNGQIVMVAKIDKNPDYEDWMQTILGAFQEQYKIHKMPYKIVYGTSFLNTIGSNKYLSLIDFIHGNIPENTTHRIDDKDIARFEDNEFILSELEDIYKKCDLNDPRVMVFCQPVFNIQTKRFDTAEALMRLALENVGLISPVVFIPMAEKRGYIHVLTKIILNKTCQTIKKLNDEGGFILNRISINVSMIELKDKNFCSDINRIIHDNNIPGHKIAIELTESQNEEDFMIMKERIEVLHEEGIQFYLDDFGTGYSNMERILELPFDIIKFDRSMVIASGQDERSERIVENLARMFSDFNYRVLYEGIEDNADENRCLSMSATYLQGFKYSKPIPIGQLHTFLTKSN